MRIPIGSKYITPILQCHKHGSVKQFGIKLLLDYTKPAGQYFLSISLGKYYFYVGIGIYKDFSKRKKKG